MVLHPFAKELQSHEISGDEVTNQEYEAHNGSFATYFRNKQIKSDTQAKEKHSLKSNIFQNCLIYITGHTNPSAPESKRLIIENGGQICAFLGGKTYCTHIIATSLTSRKEVLYRNMKVVKPAWVTESIKMGSPLPWSRYRTVQIPGNQMFESEPVKIDITEKANSPSPSSKDVPSNTSDTAKENNLEVIMSSEDEDDTHTASSRIVGNDEYSKVATPATRATYDSSFLEVHGPEGDAARTAWILEQRCRVNCLDPTFIKDYFEKSRLHFLSTRKLELKHRCRKYVSPFAGRPIKPGQKRVLLHVDFDSFFVAVASKKRPHLMHEPVCVSYGSDASDIASCNYVARQKGVANGQWVAKAKSLCPNLICLPYDFDEYDSCSKVLYETLLGLSPDKISAISVDEAMIDITHLATARPVDDICKQIRNKINEATGINVSIGVGYNIMTAKLALRRAKPNGVCVFHNKENIGDFNVRDLPGVGSHAFSQLDNIGIDTLNSLSRYPLSALQSASGNASGQKVYNYGQGIDDDDVSSLDVPVRTIGLEIGWGVRLINEMEVLEFVENCSNELWDRIERSGQNIDLITVKVHIRSSGSTFVTPKYMGRGSCDAQSRSQKVSPSMKKEELFTAIHSLISKIPCEPSEFRGLGLHVKVSDPIMISDPHQGRILFQSRGNTSPNKEAVSPATKSPVTPNKKPMYSIPPRRRRKRIKTSTQFSVSDRSNEEVVSEKIDMKVLQELPSQIRREILLHEDDYVVARDLKKEAHSDTKESLSKGPVLTKTPFLGTTEPSQLRKNIKLWVYSYDCPLKEDASSFSKFISESIQHDSMWISTLELFEHFKFIIEMKSSADEKSNITGKWRLLRDLIESQLQTKLAARLA